MDAAGIGAIAVFADLDEDQLNCVAGACRDMDVTEGTTLTEQGEFGYAMFAVKQGTADVFKDGELIRTLGPGDVFGEIAVLFGGVRTATVVAKTPMKPSRPRGSGSCGQAPRDGQRAPQRRLAERTMKAGASPRPPFAPRSRTGSSGSASSDA